MTGVQTCALPISALEETSLRLELVDGSPFTDSAAYYEVWVYRLESSREP